MSKVVFSIVFIACTSSMNAQGVGKLQYLLNRVVDGIWTSNNEENTNEPEDFEIFFMIFQNWADSASVTGNIYGVTNAGDTSQLMEVWNFVDQSDNTIFLVQRTAWGGKGVGWITPYEDDHLDIQFETTLADGRSFFTRDIHYFESDDLIKATTSHKSSEEEEWKESSTSTWIRQHINQKP